MNDGVLAAAAHQPGSWHRLARRDLQHLIDVLVEAGHRVVGPQVADGAIVLRDLAHADDLPHGWLDEQDGGSYRLRHDPGAGPFDHVVGPHSLKNFLFPPRDTLQRWVRVAGSWQEQAIPRDEPPLAVIGARACDLQALAVQDAIFIREDYADPAYEHGIAETFTIDQSKHSLFGASKVAADVMVQEYGRYFGLPTCALRGGCLTGPNHSGVELHGFLSYLVKCNLEGREYRVFGYQGKQVRDNIHSLDVARFMAAFVASPRAGEVYNLGGGKANSCSILEAFKIAERFSGTAQVYTYVDQNRAGDHICYYSDLRKMRAHYPAWDITQSLEETIRQIVDAWRRRQKS